MASSSLQASLRPQQHRQRSLSISRSGYTATSCIYCGQDFAAVDERRAHESDHFVDPDYRIWECDLCRRRFYSNVALEQHIHSKHTTCRFCSSRRENGATLPESGDFYCGDCDRSFPDILAFLQHDQAAHISCQHCDEIGKISSRTTFDLHCCGCDAEITNDAELEQHYRANPTHYHEHPNFEPKHTRFPTVGSMLPPPTPAESSSSRRPPLSTLIPTNVQVSVTPATPVEEPQQPPVPPARPRPSQPTSTPRSQYGLPPQRSLQPASSARRAQSSRFTCPECRIPFPDAATLARHGAFSFNVISRCETRFACPFTLLRHIEMGHCCQWSAPDRPSGSIPSMAGRGFGRGDDVRMQGT